MQRITTYRKQYNASKETTLQELKKTYRGFMKEWHPDKFNNDAEKLAVAETKSTELIEAYHFLVSISSETHTSQLEDYTATMNTRIEGLMYKKQILEVSFLDGSVYEYFGVPHNVYLKLYNSDKQNRFGKRHLFNSFLYRCATKKN